jgi:SulP family sulfate permease
MTLPVPTWLRGYDRRWVGADVVAGLTAAAVVIPKAMAYATIAGLPVQVGLCTAFVPGIVYALLGGSRVLSTSTTTTLAILTAAALGEALPGADAARLLAGVATLAMLVGVILVVAAILRLGFVANFISEPVLAGFKAGIGLVIVVDQLPKLFGLHVVKVGFLRELGSLLASLGKTSIPTLLVSISAAALLVLLHRWLPRVPASLVAVGLGIAASAAFGLAAHGVKVVGAIPAGLPSPVLPDLDLLRVLWPAAIGIALMSFTETIAAGRAFVAHGDHRPAANRELLATGIANAAGGLLGAMPAGGGTSQTAVNDRAGAKTQLAGLVTGIAAVATLLFLSPALALLPQAVLAAIVVFYSVELVSLSEFRAIARVRRMELVWSIAAFGGVVLLGTLEGITVAVVISLLALAQQTNHPPVYAVGRKPGTNGFRKLTDRHAEDETFPGLLLIRVEGRIYFGNAERVMDLMAPLVQASNPRVIVLDCSAIADLEYSALKMLADVEERVRASGAELWVAALNPEVRPVVERSPLGEQLGHERMCFNLEDALARFQGAPSHGSGGTS